MSRRCCLYLLGAARFHLVVPSAAPPPSEQPAGQSAPEQLREQLKAAAALVKELQRVTQQCNSISQTCTEWMRGFDDANRLVSLAQSHN